MKVYIIFLFIPIILVLFAHKPSEKVVEIQKIHVLQNSIDSLIKENKLIKEEIEKNVSIFKQEVDSINTVTKNFIEEVKLLKKIRI